MGDRISLNRAESVFEIAMIGAEPRRWRFRDVDLLWSPDLEIWEECAPLLFPVVGWTADGVRCRGRHYPLGLHGFARHCVFQPIEILSDFVRLRLSADDSTRKLYPFEFQLDVIFQLFDNGLDWRVEVMNLGREDMPYAVGLHPGFCWPLAGSHARHSFSFDQAEDSNVPIIAPGGLFSARKRPTRLKDGRLELTAEDFANEALCFLNIKSRKLRYDNGENFKLTFEMNNYNHIALWARPPAPFLCIEAWTGFGDPEGFKGDIFEKPSMRVLAPYAMAAHSMRINAGPLVLS